jgi:hypothetical protein
MSERSNSPHNVSAILSSVPGRMRIKLHPSGRQPAVMKRLKEKMESHKGMHRVRLNHTTGSLTLNYDHNRLTKDGVLGFLEDLDVVAKELSPGLKDSLPEVAGGAGSSLSFLQAIEDLSLRVWRRTGVRLDLKLALPLAFALAGLWSIRKQGFMIAAVPGWVFLWMAFDMFVKLHPHRQ